MDAKQKCDNCGEVCYNEFHDKEKVFCSAECLKEDYEKLEKEIKSLPGLLPYVVGAYRPDDNTYYFKLFLGDKRTKKISLPRLYKGIGLIEAKSLKDAMVQLKTRISDFKNIKKISNEEFEAKGTSKNQIKN